MQHLRLKANWRDQYGFPGDGGSHPFTDDDQIMSVFRAHRVHTALVACLRYPSVPSRLAERGIVSIGIDEDPARIGQGIDEAQKRRTPNVFFFGGNADAVVGEFDLAVIDLIECINPAIHLAAAMAHVRRSGLLLVISQPDHALDYNSEWQVLHVSSFRTARPNGLLEGTLAEEHVSIARRKE